MKHLEKEVDHLSEELNEKNRTEGKEVSNPVPETDALLQDLEALLEISKNKKPKETPASAEAGTAQQNAEEVKHPAQNPEATADAGRAPVEQESHPEEEPLDTLASIFSGGSAEEEKTEAETEQRNNTRFFEPVSKKEEALRDAPPAPSAQADVDDDHLLAELHALIGDPEKPKSANRSVRSSFSRPERPLTAPAPRPLARITPDALQNEPEELEGVMEADTLGVPGWLKGAFILLLSLLLCAMTFYAVASDVIGEIF